MNQHTSHVSSLLYRLADDLLHCILKTVVRESCLLVTKCQTVARDDFQKLLSTVPVRVAAQQNQTGPAFTEITPEMVLLVCRWSRPVSVTSWLFRTTFLATQFLSDRTRVMTVTAPYRGKH